MECLRETSGNASGSAQAIPRKFSGNAQAVRRERPGSFQGAPRESERKLNSMNGN